MRYVFLCLDCFRYRIATYDLMYYTTQRHFTCMNIYVCFELMLYMYNHHVGPFGKEQSVIVKDGEDGAMPEWCGVYNDNECIESVPQC